MEAIKDWGHVERREESQEMMIQLAQARRSTPVPSFWFWLRQNDDAPGLAAVPDQA
jgi:hypothetical protein